MSQLPTGSFDSRMLNFIAAGYTHFYILAIVLGTVSCITALLTMRYILPLWTNIIGIPYGILTLFMITCFDKRHSALLLQRAEIVFLFLQVFGLAIAFGFTFSGSTWLMLPIVFVLVPAASYFALLDAAVHLSPSVKFIQSLLSGGLFLATLSFFLLTDTLTDDRVEILHVSASVVDFIGNRLLTIVLFCMRYAVQTLRFPHRYVVLTSPLGRPPVD